MAGRIRSDAEMDKEVKTMGQILSEQPKRSVKLWLSQEERKKLEAAKEGGKQVEWPSEFVSVNGYNYQIQKGVEVQVPQVVAEILEQAGLI